MRVLVTTDTVGGVWSLTRELVTGFMRKECDVALVSIGPLPSSDQRRWVSEFQSKWVKHFQFDSIDTPLEWMRSNESSFRGASVALARIAQDFGADLLHSNQFCFGALQCEIPKVVTAHSDVFSWAKACRPEGLENSDWLRRYRSLVQQGLFGADLLVAPSRWMACALAEHFKVRCEMQVIPNGRDISQMPASARQMQAVTAGRLWDEGKNIEMLCAVSSPIPLLVAGDTRFEGAETWHATANVKLLGKLSEAEMFDLFRRSEIYICTSRYEPFGLAPLEAALCGCAILANDIPSLREVWGDGARYFTDANSLSQLLNRLHEDPKLLSDAKASSQNRAQNYSCERMTTSYLSLFKATLALDREIAHVG